MTIMLGFLLVTVLMALTSAVNVMEYNEEAKAWLEENAPKTYRKTVTITNAGNKFEFHVRRSGGFENGLFFEPMPTNHRAKKHLLSSDEPAKHTECGLTVGIRVWGLRGIFCGPRAIVLNVNPENDSDKYTIQLLAYFQSPHTSDNLTIGIPIFKEPSKAFTTEKRPELFVPDGLKKISDVLENKPIKFDFQLLEGLLKQGLYTSSRQYTYTTNPVIWPEDILEEFVRVVTIWKSKHNTKYFQ